MSWLRKMLAAFRGSDSGQSMVEYLIIVGTCALVGIAAFTRYGQAVKSDLNPTGQSPNLTLRRHSACDSPVTSTTST